MSLVRYDRSHAYFVKTDQPVRITKWDGKFPLKAVTIDDPASFHPTNWTTMPDSVEILVIHYPAATGTDVSEIIIPKLPSSLRHFFFVSASGSFDHFQTSPDSGVGLSLTLECLPGNLETFAVEAKFVSVLHRQWPATLVNMRICTLLFACGMADTKAPGLDLSHCASLSSLYLLLHVYGNNTLMVPEHPLGSLDALIYSCANMDQRFNTNLRHDGLRVFMPFTIQTSINFFRLRFPSKLVGVCHTCLKTSSITVNPATSCYMTRCQNTRCRAGRWASLLTCSECEVYRAPPVFPLRYELSKHFADRFCLRCRMVCPCARCGKKNYKDDNSEEFQFQMQFLADLQR